MVKLAIGWLLFATGLYCAFRSIQLGNEASRSAVEFGVNGPGCRSLVAAAQNWRLLAVACGIIGSISWLPCRPKTWQRAVVLVVLVASDITVGAFIVQRLAQNAEDSKEIDRVFGAADAPGPSAALENRSWHPVLGPN